MFFLHLHCIYCIVKTDDAISVATAMVSSRLDYCNSVLYGTTAKHIGKLQRVHNALARIVARSSRRDHIMPVLAELHWLPIAARIEFKLAMLTFKTLQTKQPAYLYELLHFNVPARQTRSSVHNKLLEIGVRTNFASRAFCHAAPALWNSLSTDITDDLNCSVNAFKCKLKTYLFARSFLT